MASSCPQIRLSQARIERSARLALKGSIALVLVSIAVSQILLAAALAGALWLHGKDVLKIAKKFGFVLPALIFFVWTLLTALVAPNPLQGLTIAKKFYLFLILFLVPVLAPGASRAVSAYRTIFAVAAISSAAGLTQFVVNPHRDLLHRISGFMSQWMTYSGLLMLVLVGLAAYGVCFGWWKHKWTLPLGTLIALALLASQTRNAWLGAAAGVVVVVLLRKPRSIVLLLVLLVGMYLVAPASIKHRLWSGLDPADPNTRNRIELFGTSLRLINDNFWFGVGPKNVNTEALRYRGTQEFPDWMYQHMHNNFLQITAERGVPGLLLWLVFMASILWGAVSRYRARPDEEGQMVCIAAVGAWVALIVAGTLEYNFGDSEVLTLFLFMMSAPYALGERSPVSEKTGEHPRFSVAILGTRGIPANYGGFETFAEECSARLAARGHEVTVYCRSHYISPSLKSHRGVNLTVLPTLAWKYTDTVLHTFLSTCHALFREFDVILICNAANSVFALLPRVIGTPVVVNVDGIERLRKKWNWAGKGYYLLSERFSTWFPSAIVTDARVIEEYYQRKYRKKSHFIPYGAVTEKPQGEEVLRELGLKSGDYFLYVSRFEPENNPDLVIAAFEKVNTSKKLVMVGDAPYSREYIERLKRTRDSRVIFPGAIYGAGYRQLQTHAYCYIHATEVGGTHPALIEAMGRGSLIIANGTPENAEVLAGTGILYRKNDEPDLTSRIQEVADSPESFSAYKRAALERARTAYSWDTVVDQYEQLFASLVHKSVRGSRFAVRSQTSGR